ncbi:YusW family protein [Kurthia gibsonii]|uniref:YusW family protein n=1 Tax=Kurthia gibsonii TaxID=33946 RepID=UPI003015A458
MNKKLALYAVPLLALSLAACSTDKDEKKEETKVEEPASDTTNDSSSTDSSKDDSSTNEKVTEQPYKKMDLDVEYDKGDYTFEYEKKSDGDIAEIEDERDNTKKTGDEALGEMQPIVEKFTFDQNSSDEEVKKQIMDNIKIDDNYKSIKLEVKFDDGKEKEYKFVK